MPQKNTLKISIENSYYHIYNRGVAKGKIFKDNQDYKVFLNYLKEALSPPLPPNKIPKIKIDVKGTSFTKVPRLPKNFHNKIELIAYCLMPNHFHFLIKQVVKGQMEAFMRSISTRYSMYFNKKYERVGPLFQGRYKAVLIEQNNYLLHLTRYIHLNPSEITNNILDSYSSYADYLGLKSTKWIKPNEVLGFFKNQNIPELKKDNSYKKFVENNRKSDQKILGELILE